jgi:hypothetical protein
MRIFRLLPMAGLGTVALLAQVSPTEVLMENATRVTRTGVTVTIVDGQLQAGEPAGPGPQEVLSCRFRASKQIGSKPHLGKLVPGSLRFDLDGSCTADWMEVELTWPEVQLVLQHIKSMADPVAEPAESAQPTDPGAPTATRTQHYGSVWYEDPVYLILNQVETWVQYDDYPDGHITPVASSRFGPSRPKLEKRMVPEVT